MPSSEFIPCIFGANRSWRDALFPRRGRWLDPTAQLRANSWMLMTGSLGMLASTLPVQWLVPVIRWPPLFWARAVLILLSFAPDGADRFFSYGGMIAMQTLWAAPWLVRVAGYPPLDAAGRLFAINTCMLATFLGRVHSTRSWRDAATQPAA